MSGRFLGRVRNLERDQPAPGDSDALCKRIERSRQRVVDLMSDQEWNRSQEPDRIADRRAKRDAVMGVAAIAHRRGRKPLFADMLRAVRG